MNEIENLGSTTAFGEGGTPNTCDFDTLRDTERASVSVLRYELSISSTVRRTAISHIGAMS